MLLLFNCYIYIYQPFCTSCLRYKASFKLSLTGLNSKLFFSYTSFNTRIKHHKWRENSWIHCGPKSISALRNAKRIRSWVAVFPTMVTIAPRTLPYNCLFLHIGIICNNQAFSICMTWLLAVGFRMRPRWYLLLARRPRVIYGEKKGSRK